MKKPPTSPALNYGCMPTVKILRPFLKKNHVTMKMVVEHFQSKRLLCHTAPLMEEVPQPKSKGFRDKKERKRIPLIVPTIFFLQHKGQGKQSLDKNVISIEMCYLPIGVLVEHIITSTGLWRPDQYKTSRAKEVK